MSETIFYAKLSLPADFSTDEIVQKAIACEDAGADALLVAMNESSTASHEAAIEQIRQICLAADLPVCVYGCIHRLEDVKKYLYTGAASVLFREDVSGDMIVYPEACSRFGKEKCVLMKEGVFAVNEGESPVVQDALDSTPDFYALKKQAEEEGKTVRRFTSAMSFDQLHPDKNGLIPAIVQDYKTGEVLMLAYMNEEAFNQTIATGKMTYFSRNRQSLWVKGETSGHFQYVKELRIDCDEDTILAKVRQVGAACHTGNRSCFYRTLASRGEEHVNPLTVLEEVYDTICDRKVNPKEGSYTNYLFDKGIDKILKKCGEEATEIVIAAKNPDPQETVYEMSDFLYHMMVLMAEKKISWTDLTRELANRH
ncbi:MAG: bifunctional phosphoribosyl-AMP cyclohydrolase/phosphoribosyl-ATP diphosphatase HisIE [Lachnospiraceae bacterium]|nr:bifunctional phosphoribosyl-AMP cyclohydrolase/phosphoribosyl-ATP diphosphatase HisIE [Lachnospiraceae bacterium]